MASNISTDMCDICESRKKANPAIKWCPECEEKLCDECYGNHSVSKLSRNHDVIDIEQYRQLPKSMLEVKNFCDQHNMQFTCLCRQHDVLCCAVCSSESGDHMTCTTIAIQEVIQTAKTSVLLQSLEETVQNVKDNLKTIINDRKLNLQKLHDQKEDILKQVKQMRDKITKELIAFEKKIADELDKKIKKNDNQVKSEIASLEKNLQEAETMSNESNTIKQYGSDLQMFVRSKSMEKEINKINKNIQELVNNKNLKRVEVKLEWDTKVNDFMVGMSSLGTVLEEEMLAPIVLAPVKGQQVQMMQSTPNMSIEDISITQEGTFTFEGQSRNVWITGCSICPNGKVVLADRNNKSIILLNENGKEEKVIPVSFYPRDVTIIDDTTVAVSSDEGVIVINITNNKVEKTLKTRLCDGVDYYKGNLYCYVSDKGILSVNLSTTTTTVIVPEKVSSNWCYIAVYIDRIYNTLSTLHVVRCYTITGEKVWEFNDPSVIKSPVGIAVDNSSNVYIASKFNHSIVVLSSDGQRHRTLLTKKDGIKFPLALHFDRSRNQLQVANEEAPVLLFSI